MQRAAHPLAQLDGAHGEGLVRPLALHLEALGRGQRSAQIGPGRVENGLLALLAGQRPGDGDDAEHLLAGSVSPGDVAGLLRRLHIDSGLAGIYLPLAESLGAAADVAHQLHLKAAAVQSLQDHLAQLAQNDLVHMVLSLLLVYRYGDGGRAASSAPTTGRRTPRAFVPLRSTAGRRPLRTFIGGVPGLTMVGRKRSRHGGEIFCPADGRPTTAYRVYVEEV